MLQFISYKERCTGCGACYSICPKHCISMKMDAEGFLYPEGSDECIHCNLCEQVCPIHQQRILAKDNLQIAYAGLSKRYDVWKRSSSGGAFSEICTAWGDEETYVYGAAWEGLEVKHVGIKNVKSISPICKSKYISSEIGESFIKAKQQLESGHRVIFSGTPCQIAGLKKYLNKEYDNLLLIDLICHGVGSPKVFKACINVMEREFGKEIKGYEFRCKRKKYERDHLNAISTVESDEPFYVVNDNYMQLFLRQDCLRPSCGTNCIYRTDARQGDITLADFKGLEQVFPELLGNKKNYSTIIFNTEKARSFLKNLMERMELLPCELDDIKKYNPLFYRSTPSSPNREAFFYDFVESPDDAVQKWTIATQIYKRTFLRIVYDNLPVFLRRNSLRIIFFVKDYKSKNER